MSTYIGIGFSKDLDTLKAAHEAAEQAKFNLRCEQIDLAIILNTSHYDPAEFLPQVFESLKRTKLVGSSTAAIILSERIEPRGIAVLAVYSEEIRFEVGATDHLNLRDLKAAGMELAKNCLSDYGKEHRKLFFFFADGLLQELSQYIAGISEFYGSTFPVIGAGSSDDFHFQKTHQYYNNTALSSGACGVLFGGRMQVGASCRHGWLPLGKPRIIDEVEGNVVKTIDHQPASRIYQEYFDTEAETLKASSLTHLNIHYPLGVPVGKKREYLLRNVIKTLEDDSIVFQDSVPQGKEIHLMIGNKDSCQRAAETAAREIKAQFENQTPKLILVMESMARYRILGRSAMAEIQKVRDILGPAAPFLGMYTFGEVFTYTTPDGPQTLLQNESIMIIAIY